MVPSVYYLNKWYFPRSTLLLKQIGELVVLHAVLIKCKLSMFTNKQANKTVPKLTSVDHKMKEPSGTVCVL